MPHQTIERCPWPQIDDPLYARYHDTEWGVPLSDSRALFEKLVLESFQSGLSWLTILRKRDNFRKAFDNFDANRIARYGAEDVEHLMQNIGIVRNRAKIEATIANARAYIEIVKQQTFASFVWSHIGEAPVQNAHRTLADVPSKTDVSVRLSRSLKAAGFGFVGPTTAYAFMQSSGMVNDHLIDCPRHDACRKLQMSMTVPK